MPHLAPDKITLIRKLYEDSELTVAEIAILGEVSESAIYQRARRERWTSARQPGITPRKEKLRQPPPPTPALLALAGETGDGEILVPSGTPSGAPGGVPASEDGAFADVDRAETARRLWLAVNRHLADLHENGAPESMVRAAQNFAALARTLETLVDVERSLDAGRQAANRYPDEGPEDIDEFRNEIARRLEAMLGIDPPPGAE